MIIMMHAMLIIMMNTIMRRVKIVMVKVVDI